MKSMRRRGLHGRNPTRKSLQILVPLRQRVRNPDTELLARIVNPSVQCSIMISQVR